METMTKDQAIKLIFTSIPYSQHITNLDSESKVNEIRFTWRHTKFMVEYKSLGVWEIGDGVIIGSNVAILLEKILIQL